MTTTMPTRAAIDRAEPLDFPDRKPARQELTLTIKARVNGFDVDVCFSGHVEQLDAMTKRLRELGAEPVSRAPTPAAAAVPTRKPMTGITPAYDGSGQPMCPVHHKPLSEGRYGMYCPSKAEGEHANAKGWCNIRFAE